jgi:RNA polymerase sigma-70 factor (ECF subfamily)
LAPLLEAAMAGDRPALDALLLKLRPYLHSLVRARLGPDPRPGLDNSALVQEGLLRIFESIGGFRGHTVPHLLGWVGQIVRHLVIDALRANSREMGKVPIEPPLEPWGLDPPADAGDGRERRALRVAEALNRLPERRRQVIELSFFEQLSDAEIARRLGGSAGAVRVLRFRALQEIRQLLQACPDSDCRPILHPASIEGSNG